MEFPVRCFTCGSVIGHFYQDYKKLAAEKTAEVAMDELGVHRYCCRRMFVSYVDIVDTIIRYPRA